MSGCDRFRTSCDLSAIHVSVMGHNTVQCGLGLDLGSQCEL